MSDRLFSLAQEIAQIRQQSQSGWSEAKAFDDDSLSGNRLAQLENQQAQMKQSAAPRNPSEARSRSSPSTGRSLSQQSSLLSEQLAGKVKLTSVFHHTRTNISLFVDSLFDSTFRPTLKGKIDAAIQANQTEAWLIDRDELDIILNTWHNVWKKTLKDRNILNTVYDQDLSNQTHPQDSELIQFLCEYINTNSLCMFEPDLEADAQLVNGKVKYRLKGYKKQVIHSAHNRRQDENVRRFLELLAAGAHFVVIHGSNDLKGLNVTVPAFYDKFPLPYRWSLYNSHYAGVHDIPFGGGSQPISPGNFTTGMAYPKEITNDTTPNSCPFVTALLVGRTAWHVPLIGTNYNSFFQLEGWPQTMWSISSRHGQDYQTHNQTKWNISTYGACPFSEKRGATVFIAPETWNANSKMSAATVMARYVGAETPQGWLDKSLVYKIGAIEV